MQCCDCDNYMTDLTADRAFCWCDDFTFACCDGCSKAEATSGESCHIICSECSPADVHEATRRKCVHCEFSNCNDWDNAVAGPEEDTIAYTQCTCSAIGDLTWDCFQQWDGSWCCSSLGTVTSDLACTTAVPDWPNPRDGCEDEWSDAADKIQRHEDEHNRREDMECGAIAGQFNAIPLFCDPRYEEAYAELIDHINELLDNYELRVAAQAEYVDIPGGQWSAPSFDCTCGQ